MSPKQKILAQRKFNPFMCHAFCKRVCSKITSHSKSWPPSITLWDLPSRFFPKFRTPPHPCDVRFEQSLTLDSSSRPAPKITANFVDPEVVKRSEKMTSSINDLNQFAFFLRYDFYFVFGCRKEEEEKTENANIRRNTSSRVRMRWIKINQSKKALRIPTSNLQLFLK